MKKFITALIAFICLLTIKPIETTAAPIDIGSHFQKKDVLNVCIVTNVTLQHFGFKSHIPPDVGKIYFNDINIDKTTSIYNMENSKQNVKADFKVGWNLKGSLLTNIYKEEKERPHSVAKL